MQGFLVRVKKTGVTIPREPSMLLKVTGRVDLNCISKLMRKTFQYPNRSWIAQQVYEIFSVEKIENEITEFSVIFIFKNIEKYGNA